jgi:hypothetical protein
METLLIQSDSKKTTRLLPELSRELGLRRKRLSKEELEDFELAKEIQEGLKSKTVSRSKVLKALTN